MTKAILVAGSHSGVGKTTVAVGLAAALRKRGLRVQTFKTGPDYLDPGYLALASGRPCVNLDLWLMPKQAVLESYARHAADADICVIEGMMGLFDGMGMKDSAVSTADIDGLIGAPVLLVVDASAMVESAAAVVHGFATFGQIPVKGVVFNRVGEKHHAMLKRAVDVAGDVAAMGYLPSGSDLRIPERQLGLVSADERSAEELFPKLVDVVERTVDVKAVLEMAASAAEHPKPPAVEKPAKRRARIAVARDEAFHFYYAHNLDALEQAGAELAPFSPLRDAQIPAGAGALYLGGGFPEVHAQRLDENRPLREAVRKAVHRGMPVYAECGGLMYLATHLIGHGIRAWEMAGAIPGEIEMRRDLQSFGYATAEALRTTFLVKAGERFRGHEFHYSGWSAEGGKESVYRVTRPGRGDGRLEGHGMDNLHASYVHLHFASAPQLPGRFVDAAEAWTAKGGAARKTIKKKKPSKKK